MFVKKKRVKLVAIAAKLDGVLVERCRKKMDKDRLTDDCPTWRDLFEYGIACYLDEREKK